MVELGEDGKYEVITRAMKPLLFGKFIFIMGKGLLLLLLHVSVSVFTLIPDLLFPGYRQSYGRLFFPP